MTNHFRAESLEANSHVRDSSTYTGYDAKTVPAFTHTMKDVLPFEFQATFQFPRSSSQFNNKLLQGLTPLGSNVCDIQNAVGTEQLNQRH